MEEIITLETTVTGNVEVEVEGFGHASMQGQGHTLGELCAMLHVMRTGRPLLGGDNDFQLISFDPEKKCLKARKITQTL